MQRPPFSLNNVHERALKNFQLEMVAYRYWASRLGDASPSKGEVSLQVLQQLRDDEASAPIKLQQQQQPQEVEEQREAKEAQVEEAQALAGASVAITVVNQVVVAETNKNKIIHR